MVGLDYIQGGFHQAPSYFPAADRKRGYIKRIIRRIDFDLATCDDGISTLGWWWWWWRWDHLGWEGEYEKEEVEEVVLVDVVARGIRSWIGRHESFWQLWCSIYCLLSSYWLLWSSSTQAFLNIMIVTSNGGLHAMKKKLVTVKNDIQMCW